MKVPNLRDDSFIGEPKHVDDTKMLTGTARETPDTVNGTNENKEHVVSHPQFGELGAKGRKG